MLLFHILLELCIFNCRTGREVLLCEVDGLEALLHRLNKIGNMHKHIFDRLRLMLLGTSGHLKK